MWSEQTSTVQVPNSQDIATIVEIRLHSLLLCEMQKMERPKIEIPKTERLKMEKPKICQKWIYLEIESHSVNYPSSAPCCCLVAVGDL